ncbi:MAG TPA: cytochrome c3 family protein [Gemmatimonadales bacterium]|nr:cytochrome c3 family protein [Gemmatimonadales bacterium]
MPSRLAAIPVRAHTGILVGALALAGCTDTVFRDREPFNPPPDQASGFLGYFTTSDRQTSCGNCHAGIQGRWVETAHAQAYQDLVANPGAQDFCFTCHTVSENGNPAGLTGQPAGWNVVEDTAYHDVQCESCHGPGFEHAQAPDETNAPLARAGVKDTAASCAACHSGTHHPFVEQWAQTGHADSTTNAYPGNRTECASCHNGKAFIVAARGGQTRFVEEGGGAYQFAITCATCHDPHSNVNEGQLRFPIDDPAPENNLCMRCHNRSTEPTTSFTRGSRGAHASQGPVLLGQGAGWIPPGFIYDTNQVFTSHASVANPRLCAGCHVNSFEVTDQATGDFVFQSVGHLFSPNPCLDAQGIPVKDNTCAYTSTARNWSSCTASGCHGSVDVAVQLLNTERTQVQQLVDVLWQDLNADQVLDAAPTDAGYLPLVFQSTPTEFVGTDNKLTTAEGVLFNVMMLAEDLYDHHDGSKGVHNPFFYEALLSASIEAMQAAYPGLPPAAPPVQALMQKALSRPGISFDRAKFRAVAVR